MDVECGEFVIEIMSFFSKIESNIHATPRDRMNTLNNCSKPIRWMALKLYTFASLYRHPE